MISKLIDSPVAANSDFGTPGITGILQRRQSFTTAKIKSHHEVKKTTSSEKSASKDVVTEEIESTICTVFSSVQSTQTTCFSNETSLASEEEVEMIPGRVRKIMRHVPQSIAILTTREKPHPRADDTVEDSINSKGIGITLSSVNTVTLEPEPIISFNIKKPSHTLDAIRHHGHFLIHFPTCSRAGAHLSDSFSRGFLQSHDLQLQTFCKSIPVSVLNILGQNISLPALFSPSYPVSYILKCESFGKDGFIDVADHVIVLGKVKKTWFKKDSSLQPTCESLSLGYVDGSYCSLSQKLPG